MCAIVIKVRTWPSLSVGMYVVCVCACMHVLCGMAESAIFNSSCLILTLSLSCGSRSVTKVSGYTCSLSLAVHIALWSGIQQSQLLCRSILKCGGSPGPRNRKPVRVFPSHRKDERGACSHRPQGYSCTTAWWLCKEQSSSVWSVVFPLAPLIYSSSEKE